MGSLLRILITKMHFTRNKLLLRLALIVPIAALATSCGGKVSLSGQDQSLANPAVTRAVNEKLYPNDVPSSADGKVVWDQVSKSQNCATCHTGGTGQNFSDLALMRRTKPIDQFMTVAYGIDPRGETIPKHPALSNKLTTRQMWDLVFYVRSIPMTALSTKELTDIDAIFGGNCAVCHGKKGNGDGPLAHNLEPVPANFKQFDRFYDRDDNTLYDHIANGIKWEGMPNFLHKKVQDATKKELEIDDAYTFKLVQYVRRFHSTDTPTMIAEGNKSSEDKSSANAPKGTQGNNQK